MSEMIRFITPSNVERDFEAVLQTDMAHDYIVNFDEENVIRAMMPRVNNRTKFNNSDNTRWLNTSVKYGLRKGDYLTGVSKANNYDYIITWTEYEQYPASIYTQVQICNSRQTFRRWSNAEYDNSGNLIEDEGFNTTIVENIPCISWERGSSTLDNPRGGVGQIPDSTRIIAMQYNEITSQIDIKDVTRFKRAIFEVFHIDDTQLNPDGESGLLVLHCRKVVE